MTEDFRGVSEQLVRGVAEGCFPGAVLAVGYGGQLVFEAALGDAAVTPTRRPMALDTVFDLASLTKPLATATAIMLLVEAGMVRLETPLNAYIPAFHGDERASPSLRQLLTHCAGLPAWRPFYREIDPSWPPSERRRALYGAVHREPPVAVPGTMVQYSDVGFLLLGELIETIAGMDLDVFCRRAIFDPLGLGGIGFIHLARPRPADVCFASTEACPWRQRVLDGEVHDENAWIMGGVAGHAGLFATARQVWRFAQSLLDGLDGKPWLVSRAILQMFTQRQRVPPHSTWALGWDTPTPGQSSAGRYVSPTAIGHLGFTGTSLWIDPVQHVVVVLLTNRVHPSRQRDGIRAFRPALHDAVMQALKLA